MSITRPLAVVAAATLVAGLTSAPANAAPTYDPKPVKAGAGWLTDQLTDGLVNNEQYQLRRLRPVDRRRPRPRRRRQEADGRQGRSPRRWPRTSASTRRTSRTPTSTSTPAPPPRPPSSQRPGQGPAHLRRRDLVTQLEGRVAAAAPITGRIEDAFDPTDEFGGDFANVIGQAYAAQALALAGSAKAGAATAFLLQQQCAKGYFRQYFTTDKTRPDQSCQGAPRAERGASTDATALAVLALQDVKGAKAKAAVKKAVAWLEDTQLGDGAFTDTGKAEGSRQHQQHRPGRLGARRGRRHEARPSWPRPSVRAQQVVRQPVRAASWRSRSARSPTTLDALATAQACRHHEEGAATSGGAHRRRRCRCCAGRRGPRASSPSTAPRTRRRRASSPDPADRRGRGRARLRERRRARASSEFAPDATPITRSRSGFDDPGSPHLHDLARHPAPRRHGAGHGLTVSLASGSARPPRSW